MTGPDEVSDGGLELSRLMLRDENWNIGSSEMLLFLRIGFLLKELGFDIRVLLSTVS